MKTTKPTYEYQADGSTYTACFFNIRREDILDEARAKGTTVEAIVRDAVAVASKQDHEHAWDVEGIVSRLCHVIGLAAR